MPKGRSHKSCVRSACSISTHAMASELKCHWNSHRGDCSLGLPPLHISSSKHGGCISMSSPYRHSNIEIRLHSEYLQVLSLKQQKPTEASTKNIKCQKYKAAFGISDAKNRNSNVQVEELRAQQSLLPQQPQCSSYAADLHVLTLTYNTHKWENTKCSRTLSIAIS